MIYNIKNVADIRNIKSISTIEDHTKQHSEHNEDHTQQHSEHNEDHTQQRSKHNADHTQQRSDAQPCISKMSTIIKNYSRLSKANFTLILTRRLSQYTATYAIKRHETHFYL